MDLSTDLAQVLLPVVPDGEWLRIHEVPIDWVADPDRRVDIVDTARKDLQGVWRLHRAFATRSLPIRDLRAELVRKPLTARLPLTLVA